MHTKDGMRVGDLMYTALDCLHIALVCRTFHHPNVPPDAVVLDGATHFVRHRPIWGPRVSR